MNEHFVTSAKARKALGVCGETLRRWSDDKLIPSIRTPGGKRLFNIEEYINKQSDREKTCVEKQNICYCRVSSIGQKDDLQRQIAFMQERFPNHRVVTDIGSGINFNRKGLRSIIELATKGAVSEVVVAYRDRLCRFAYELVEWFLRIHEVKLLVLNQEVESSKENELAEDLLAIVNVFNCRVNGRRKYKNKTKEKHDSKEQEASSKSI
jgi:predicted site-specific integrase-resolvase